MRVLALDYGAARCGCAVSDPTGTLATPLDAVERPATRAGLGAIAGLVGELGAEVVVLGLPVSRSGGDSAQTGEVRRFAEALRARLGGAVPVELLDERFTTRMAQAVGGSSSEDSRAAAILLEDWLERRGAPSTGDAQ